MDHVIEAEPELVVPLPLGDIDGVIREIKSASLADLKNSLYLERILLPKLGFNDEILGEFPVELLPWCGFGVKSWQYPIQFSKYLVSLSHRNIANYVEIGVRHGGTFIITVEYLKRFQRISSAVAIDLQESQILSDYVKDRSEFRYLISSSTSEEAKKILSERKWDLALIDGDHSYDGCWNDFQNLRNNIRTVALHDIVNAACPGVVKAWEQIRSVLPDDRSEQFTDQYAEVLNRTGNSYLGIGIADIS